MLNLYTIIKLLAEKSAYYHMLLMNINGEYEIIQHQVCLLRDTLRSNAISETSCHSSGQSLSTVERL